MQVNEHAGQVRQGRRPPAPSNTRSKRLGAEEPRRQAARVPARKPVRYGAGF